MIIEAASLSEKGPCRKENQDAILEKYTKETGLFLVADGMGGHYLGSLASRALVDFFCVWWEDVSGFLSGMAFSDLVSELKREVQKANQQIYKLYEDMKQHGGTTMCLLLVHKKNFAVFHVGDSRLYQYSRGNFEQITIDDVWQNQIPAQKRTMNIEKDSRYGRLTQAVGWQEEIELHTITGSISGKVCFFLCSDGIYKYCAELRLKSQMKRAYWWKQTDRRIGNIKTVVYENGAKDNLSMICTIVKA